MKTCLTHARIVLEDSIIQNGSLLIEDGVISAICPDSVNDAEIYSLEGKTLMPGMIDLHCDALEKEVEPRPNVYFPLDFSCAQADKKNAAAGITTVYHAISFAHEELGVRNNDFAADITRAVYHWQKNALVDNRVHCRYEITDETGHSLLMDLLTNNSMHLLSMMDHTPGQGQFKDLIAYQDYLTRTYQKTADEVAVIVERKLEAANGAFERMESLARAAHNANISVASHDDDSAERVETMNNIGADISEFPVSVEAAHAAKKTGMSTIFGAPNILRGGSQSGSMKAIDAINEGVLDCLCSDYAPAALIAAVFSVVDQTDLDLPSAVRLVTSNPAKASRLVDRGTIAANKRADLIAVQMCAGRPQISDVWSKGSLVYGVNYGHG